MQNGSSHLSRCEEIILNLRSLYESYGYIRSQAATFEEYDFYARNRSALPGAEVLVFTDADGRLMALKPDVTMSIVKHVQEQAPGLRKICYNENIYRIPTGGAGFRESVQTGLECIGSLDSYAVGEVVMLALKSLSRIQSSYLLNLSHLGIPDGLLDQALQPGEDRLPILKAMGQKNLPALREACHGRMDPEFVQALETLTSLYGSLRDTLPTVENLVRGEKMEAALAELQQLRELMEAYGLGHRLHLDFSIRGGTDYYSGLVFRGFVQGASVPVLSGGRYDKLIRRMGKTGGGIGFAVYLDQLKRQKSGAPEEETLLLYDDTVKPEQVIRQLSVLKQDGIRVRAERQIPPECRYTRLLKLTKDGVTEIE